MQVTVLTLCHAIKHITSACSAFSLSKVNYDWSIKQKRNPKTSREFIEQLELRNLKIRNYDPL